ncbi:hypothetical protein [Rubrivirga sp. IMCC45206]|uniref:hypothetical protein n=1 Tax=Rubrivirga sp. IMCC45206 TaxID=3391614 RepID=UPI0039902B83
MLHLALVGLLAGSLALGTPGDDDDKKKKNSDTPAVENATPGVFETATAVDTRSITSDTYALGRPVAEAPIKLWASYAYGEAEEIWGTDGDATDISVATQGGDILSQRVNVGAQINFISFPAFRLGAGGLLTVAKNEFVASESNTSQFTNGIGDIESDFGLQNIKVFGTARGKVVGVHGGYIFDIGSERENGEQARANIPGFGEQPLSIDARGTVQPTALVAGNASFKPILLPATLANSDGRDAITFGADFDYPSERFRLFGGLDAYLLQGIDDDPDTAIDEASLDGDDLLNFMFGAGFKFSFFELGAALQIQTRHSAPTVESIGTAPGIGSHAGTIAPYIRISPPSLPASLFIKGGVQEEYTEYGYALGGSNSVKPAIGFTAGLAVGFN